MKKDLAIIAVLVLVLVGGGILYKTTPTVPTPVENDGEPTLNTTELRLGESETLNNVTVTPQAVIEDSRCAESVQCIWAGTVRVRTQIESGLGTATENFEINRPITTEAEEVTLVMVTPNPREGQTINPGDYRFVYKVEKRSTNVINPGNTGGCYVGGCSGQICSDVPDAVSTCEFRAEYACYRTAKCERQPSGQCGWTPTAELQMCLENPPSL